MIERLHIFAVNAPLDLRHTHLTRAQGGPQPALPPLAEWLGAPVNTDEIELFAIKDIGDLSLSEYVDMAFGVDHMGADDAQRMDALGGSVLLVPDRALEGSPATGAALTQIAVLPLAGADHRAQLPKAAVGPVAAEPVGPVAGRPPIGALPWLVAALVLVAAVVLWLA